MIHPDDVRFLTYRDAARYNGLSWQTLGRLVLDGRLVPCRPTARLEALADVPWFRGWTRWRLDQHGLLA
jgi:hypothetical protein